MRRIEIYRQCTNVHIECAVICSLLTCVCVLTSIEEPLVLITEGIEWFGEGGRGRHGVVAQGPEACIEDGDLQPALAVEGGAHGKVHYLLVHLGEGGERRD